MQTAWQTPADAQTSRALRAMEASGGRLAELVLVLAVSIPVLFLGLGLSFLDPDEGLYGDIAQRMVTSGDWVLPRFNGLPYLEKPPLYFWLSAFTLALGGAPEWSLRFWSAAAALGTVFLTRSIANALYGSPAGMLAGLALATTAGCGLYVRKASTDFVFVFCLTLSLYGFLRDAERPDRGRGRFLLFYLGAALGILAKGLIGGVLPALIVAAALVWVRRVAWRDLNLARGSALFAAVVLPWHVLVAWRDPGLFHFYVIDNQILRYLGLRAFVEDDVPISTLGFLVVSFLWLFPWSVFVLARADGKASREARWRPVVTIWTLVVIVFFMLARLRLEYYALPAFPALAVLVGGAWKSGRDIGRWLFVGLAGTLAVGGAALWVGARLTPEQALAGLAELNVYYRILREQGLAFPFPSARPFGVLLQALGVTLVVGWSLAAACWWRGWRRASFAALVGHAGVITVLIVQLLHLVEPHHSAKDVSQAIRTVAGPDDVVAHEGALEYSAALPFYTGRRITVIDGVRGDLETASRLPEAYGYFLDGTALAEAWSGPRRVFLVTQRQRGESVVGDLPVESVHALGRFGSRWLYSNRRR